MLSTLGVARGFYRFLVFSLIVLYLVPFEFIEFLELRSAFNFLFILIFSAFGAYGIMHCGHQDALGRLNKAAAALGVISACAVGLLNAGSIEFYPEGYKFLVIFIVIFFSSELARVLSVDRMISDLTYVFSLYIVSLFALLIFMGADELLKPTGPGGMYSRLDVTGSVTALSITATISIFLAAFSISCSQGVLKRSFFLFVLLASAYLLLLAASRQSIIIIALYAVIHFFSGGLFSKRAMRKRFFMIAFIVISIMAFALFTAFVNDSFYVRLFDNPSEDVSSGRLNSIYLWLGEMQAKGGPLGFGFIKNNTVQEAELLWPHNEFVRFYVEGGILGVLVICLMFFHAVVSLWVVMRSDISWRSKSLVSLVFSVMLVQILLENFINSIFFSGLCFLIMSIGSSHAYRQVGRLSMARV